MTGGSIPIEVRGDVDPRAVEQLRRCAEAGNAVRAALCADGHVGYSLPIGGVVAYPEHVSPSGVGYDIACGNKAVLTNLHYEDVEMGLPAIMDMIVERISFGVGRKNAEPVDHPVLDRIREAPFAPQRQLLTMAADQLGTVGAGNHYVDLFRDEDDRVWIGVHFGSRGFGHRTATGFLSIAQGGRFDEKAHEGEMDAPPVLLSVDSEAGQAYIEAMTLAGEYAYAGRDVVCQKVLDILGASEVESVHNHHNFAWREPVLAADGTTVTSWVVRKGATPAWSGQRGFVGATMGEDAVIMEGDDLGKAGYRATSARAQARLMHSTVHGAGREMSRTQAAGKMGQRAECAERDCDRWMPWKQYVALRDSGELSTFCERHPGARVLKRRGRVKAGRIDYAQVRVELAARGIEVRGGDADEAPAAYKRLDDVLAFHADTVRVVHRLRPIGVAMAGPDTYDPFKD